MGWTLAPSLAALRKEADRRYPDRDRKSDGTIGDAAHAARRTDHNQALPSRYPPVFVKDGGMVHAADITDDPVGGVDGDELAALILKRRDPRIRYVIWTRRIFYGPHSDGVKAKKKRPWVWEPYDGINAHEKHVHISVGYSAAAENDVSPWWGDEEQEEDDMALFKDRGDFTEVVRKAVWGGHGEVPSIQGGNSGDDVVEAAATGAQSLNNKVDKLDVRVAQLTKLFEAFLLKQGGSGNPTGKLP